MSQNFSKFKKNPMNLLHVGSIPVEFIRLRPKLLNPVQGFELKYQDLIEVNYFECVCCGNYHEAATHL